MRLAIGVIVSAGFRADTEFIFGRPQDEPKPGVEVVRHPPEGLMALCARVQNHGANQSLPAHLKITDFRCILSRKFPTDVARNQICADALASGCDYLLFLDADMVHPADLVERLLIHDKPVITARYHMKKPPFSAAIMVKHPTDVGPHKYLTVHFAKGVCEIERGGAGALLIRRDVLEAIKVRQEATWADTMKRTAHFSSAALDLLDVPQVPTCQWFKYQRGPEFPHDMTTSEDFWFFQQAREAGFKCYVDWDIDIPHVGPMAIDGSFNTPFLNAMMAEHENPDDRDRVLKNTVILGYPDGMLLDESVRIPAYQVTAGER